MSPLKKVTRIYFQHTSCVHMPVGNSNTLGLYWLITSYFEAFFLKERKKERTSLIAFISWEFLTGSFLAIINRTRAYLNFKLAARLSRLLYLKWELLSWPLHSVKRKPLLAQLSNCHNNRGKNVNSILQCLRDTTYNRFPYMTVFVKRWFITIFNANVNISRVLLMLVWNC
jgi:hypothetical protein